MGRAHLERIENELAGGKVVAVADVNLDAARAVAEPLGVKAYGTGAELIADPTVDAVLIATFGKVHASDLLAAIEAGKYVLCEKPLVTTTADALRVLEAEQRAGKKLVTVGYMRRFDVGYQQMRAALVAGEHGYATLVHCRHRNPSVPENYTTRNMIDDTASHEIDICRYRWARRSSGYGWRRRGPRPTVSNTCRTRWSWWPTPPPACGSTTR